MKVLTMRGPRNLILEEAQRPKKQVGEVLVKMETCGICGSDLTAYLGSNPTQSYPIQGIGHEGIGTVLAVEENEQGIQVGDRVALEPYTPDFTCPMCQAGRYNNCANLRVRGVHIGGMMAEYVSHPLRLTHKLPKQMDAVLAACTEPLSISLHGLERAQVKAGEWVVIFGAGTIGLLAALACMGYGATPILVDLLPTRLEFARKLGISHVIDPQKEDVVDRISHLTAGNMADAMIECTGAAKVLASMHDYVKHGGRIALVGWAKTPTIVNTIRCMQKELDIYPSRNSANLFPEAISLMESGRVLAGQIITKTCRLEEVEAVIRDMVAHPGEYLKVVVKI